MPPIWDSAGPFPKPKGFSKDVMSQAFFRTMSSTGVPGHMPNFEDRGENFDQIHSIGKRKTRYLDFQYSKSPLTDRTGCTHTRSFTPHILGDNIVNKELAKNFKEGLATGGKGADATLDGRSVHEDYTPMVGEKLMTAKPASCRPPKELTKTLGGCPELLLETVSYYHQNFKTPPLELAKPTKVVLPEPCWKLRGDTQEGDYGHLPTTGRKFHTGYSKEFKKGMDEQMKNINVQADEAVFIRSAHQSKKINKCTSDRFARSASEACKRGGQPLHGAPKFDNSIFEVHMKRNPFSAPGR